MFTVYATSGDCDEPTHQSSLVRAFTAHTHKATEYVNALVRNVGLKTH